MNQGKFEEYLVLAINQEIFKIKNILKEVAKELQSSETSKPCSLTLEQSQKDNKCTLSQLNTLKQTVLATMEQTKENFITYEILIKNRSIREISTLLPPPEPIDVYAVLAQANASPPQGESDMDSSFDLSEFYDADG